MLPLILLGACSSYPVVAPCPVDLTLLRPIVIDVRPQKPVNGDLRVSRRGLADEIALDNQRKINLTIQIRACGTP